jgi:hypothetical protein
MSKLDQFSFDFYAPRPIPDERRRALACTFAVEYELGRVPALKASFGKLLVECVLIDAHGPEISVVRLPGVARAGVSVAESAMQGDRPAARACMRDAIGRGVAAVASELAWDGAPLFLERVDRCWRMNDAFEVELHKFALRDARRATRRSVRGRIDETFVEYELHALDDKTDARQSWPLGRADQPVTLEGVRDFDRVRGIDGCYCVFAYEGHEVARFPNPFR